MPWKDITWKDLTVVKERAPKSGGGGQLYGDRRGLSGSEWSFEGDTLLLGVSDGFSRAGSMTLTTTCVNGHLEKVLLTY